jgi:serine/threonine protein kinase
MPRVFYSEEIEMSLEIGQVVGDYEVIGVVGSGGMGNVYRVRNLISDREDAMKVLLPDLTGSADQVDRFMNEIRVLASLSHPNIASLHTAFRANNQLLMVMELVNGTNLSERLHDEAIPVPEAVSYGCQVLAALAYAHSRGVIHRDIKPANIAINKEGVVKLLDFGIARGNAVRRLTRTGMVLGSLYYMSPEQVMGETADARSDVYSVGVTLYRAITGRRPIEGETDFEVMIAQARTVPPPPQHWNPAIPRPLSDAIMRALAKAPSERFRTAEEFRRALLPFAGDAPPTASARPSEATQTLSRPAPETTRPDTATTPIASTTLFHASALQAIERNLAQWLGPIAKPLVKRQSRAAASLAELCRSLAAQIASEADRRAFLKACARDLGSDAVGESASSLSASVSEATPAPPGAPAWDPAMLERIRRLLADYLGPVAKVIVERAAKRARTAQELGALLGGEVPSVKDRERFLDSFGKLLH